MVDYKTALERSKAYKYENEKDFKNDMAYTLNNMALLICECVEKRIRFKDFTLLNAKKYCYDLKKYRNDFLPLQLTLDKIARLEHLGLK